MAREQIAYGVGHVFEVPLVSQADTKLFQTSPTIAAGDAKLRNHLQALTNLAGEYVAFTSGSVEPEVGETLTGATSATTAVVIGVRLTSGTWAGGDAAGALFLEQLSGALQAENLDGSVAGANCLTIGGDSTAGLMASIGGGMAGVPVTSAEASTPLGSIELKDAAGAEWCDSGITFETYGHESAYDPQGCILTDAVGSATGQTTTNLRLSGAPATAPKVSDYFEVMSGTGKGNKGFVKTYSAGATYDVVPYVALDIALGADSVVKFFRDARVPAQIVASEDIDITTTQKASVTAAVPTVTEVTADMDANSTQLAAIVTDTGTTIPGLLGDGSAVIPNLGTALAEVTALPAANASIEDKVGFLFALLTGKATFNKTTGAVVHAQSDGATQLAGGTDTDDGTTYTKGALS